MTTSPPTVSPSSSLPSVLTMAAPLVISFWMRAAVTFVDTIYAALLGDAAVAAIGLTVPFEFAMIAVWVGLSTGLTSALSRAMGRHHGGKIDQYLRAAWQAVWIVAPAFTVVGAALWFAAPVMGLDADVARSFQVYGTVLIGGSAFTTFWSIIPDSLVKAHQDTRSTMWAGIWTNIINFSLNTLFLFVFHWGLFGIALSTVLGRIGGLSYALLRARRHEALRRADPATTHAERDPAPHRRILGLAIPSSMTFLLMAGETALVNAILARTADATESIAAYSIYYRVVLFAMQPIIATGVAMLPYAARRLGHGDVEGVRRGLREALVAAAAYTLGLVAPLLLLSGRWIAGHLAESAVTAGYAAFGLRFVPLACLAAAPFLLCRPVFEAMNRGRPGLLMALLRYVVLTVPFAWLGLALARRFAWPPLYGLVLALFAVAGISSLVFLLWTRRALGRVDPETALG